MDNSKTMIDMYRKINDAVLNMRDKPAEPEHKGLLARKAPRSNSEAEKDTKAEPIHHVAGIMAGIKKSREAYTDAS